MLFKFLEGDKIIPLVKEEHDIGDGDIEKIQSLIQCHCFTHANVKIMGEYFDVFVDDDGLIENKPILSFGDRFYFAGNILFVGRADDEGRTLDLTEKQISILKSLPIE